MNSDRFFPNKNTSWIRIDNYFADSIDSNGKTHFDTYSQHVQCYYWFCLENRRCYMSACAHDPQVPKYVSSCSCSQTA